MNRKKQVQRMISLREAREEDLVTLNAYCYNEGMDNLPGIEGVTVAVDKDDDPIGFVRVAIGNDIAHINPIVVNPYWRGYDIGRRLMENALKQYGEVRLVSRGSSLGFYRTLGAVDVTWDEIVRDEVDDCFNCELHDECCPQPVKIVK